MPTIFISGAILCSDCPARSLRAELLSLLFRDGWNILNANGDHTITLNNTEQKIIESHAFLFSPEPSVEDIFKAISVFVGYQTVDPDLQGKPTLLLNGDGSWNRLLRLLDQLNKNGTIKQNHRDFLRQVCSTDNILPTLQKASEEAPPDAGRHKEHEAPNPNAIPENIPAPAELLGNVCVFCSASIQDEEQLNAGYKLGRLLAENKLGCVSGAGKTGIMGTVVAGSVEAGGWTAGSNVPHIIELEGLPDGLSTFWLRPDIYTRMEVMIENSHAFVIMPGGAGTVQELLALLLLRSQGSPLMKNKPIVIYNPILEDDTGFWDSLIQLLQHHDRGQSYYTVKDIADIVPTITNNLQTTQGALI